MGKKERKKERKKEIKKERKKELTVISGKTIDPKMGQKCL